MRKRLDLVGGQYGRWLVLRRAPSPTRDAMWTCRCDCGTERAVVGSTLRSGRSLSCGCHRTEVTRARSTTHACARVGLRTPEYNAWKSMIGRCHRATDAGYSYYGGRGIRVCDEWRNSFGAFLSHIGARPSESHSLDRIDVDGHYEPGNVRWATRIQQARNKRTSRFLTSNGETATLAEWGERTGIGIATIKKRIDILGWSVERSVSEATQTGRRAAGVIE